MYGYRYGIRTSRKLEREAQTNMEAMWLLEGLHPKYETIANFRKDHSKAFREVFRRFVCLLKEWKPIDGETVAIDSFKIRGSNSLKNNLNPFQRFASTSAYKGLSPSGKKHHSPFAFKKKNLHFSDFS